MSAPTIDSRDPSRPSVLARHPVLTGMAIGAGSLLPPAFLPRQASLAFAAILIAFIAGIYFGFAVVNGSGRDQLVEFSVASLFAVAALLGLLYWPLLLPIAHLAMPAGIWRTTTAPACPWSPSRAGTCRGAG